MKICTIVGARPQFIKCAAVSQSLRHAGSIEEIIIHTGQHYDTNMSSVFFDELSIQMPKYNLNVGGGSHAEQTAKMLIGIEQALIKEKPDVVLVYGDTNSTLAGALSASKLHFPIAHVEAGLRSKNKQMPEEINRIVTDHVSDILFPPNDFAASILRSEGILSDKIVICGDVMYDATLIFKNSSEHFVESGNKPICLVTIHRAENTDDLSRFYNICQFINDLSHNFSIIWPIHPRIKNMISNFSLSNEIRLVDPLSYLEMLRLQSQSSLIVTDSGGMQKEAYFNRVPCITLRDETEWMETVDAGWNYLMSPAEYINTGFIKKFIESDKLQISTFGNGDASEIITKTLLERYGK